MKFLSNTLKAVWEKVAAFFGNISTDEFKNCYAEIIPATVVVETHQQAQPFSKRKGSSAKGPIPHGSFQ